MSSEKFYQVKQTVFYDVTSNIQGSAISCNINDIKAYVIHCTFFNCSTTAKDRTSQRSELVASGGACFFDIHEIEVRSCYFAFCIAPAYGSAIYVSTPVNTLMTMSCLSDFHCGNTLSDDTSIYAFERGDSHLREFNSSFARSYNMHGLILIGCYPHNSTLKFSLLIGFEKSTKNAYPLGFSIEADHKEIVENVVIYRFSNNLGLITVWRGHFQFHDCIFCECSAMFTFSLASEMPQSVICENCYFDSQITFSSFHETFSCGFDPTFTMPQIECSFYVHKFQISIFCKKEKSLISLTSLFIALHFYQK